MHLGLLQGQGCLAAFDETKVLSGPMARYFFVISLSFFKLQIPLPLARAISSKRLRPNYPNYASRNEHLHHTHVPAVQRGLV